VLATHDKGEALSMASNVAVLSRALTCAERSAELVSDPVGSLAKL
jgi:ABC-type proline/glycine betaine transport system ATPase subunit